MRLYAVALHAVIPIACLAGSLIYALIAHRIGHKAYMCIERETDCWGGELQHAVRFRGMLNVISMLLFLCGSDIYLTEISDPHIINLNVLLILSVFILSIWTRMQLWPLQHEARCNSQAIMFVAIVIFVIYFEFCALGTITP